MIFLQALLPQSAFVFTEVAEVLRIYWLFHLVMLPFHYFSLQGVGEMHDAAEVVGGMLAKSKDILLALATLLGSSNYTTTRSIWWY